MKVRFAPSPTGYMHLANARIAVLNDYFNTGAYVLRFDDTDTTRCKQEYHDQILKDLAWLGIPIDQIEYQSKRIERYKQVVELLRDFIYPCYETPDELEYQRKIQLLNKQQPRYKQVAKPHDKPHYRFKLAQCNVSWSDLVLGDVVLQAGFTSDPVVIREDGSFTYLLASVIDDFDMQITHIFRGADHVSNTGTQLHMINALNCVLAYSKTSEHTSVGQVAYQPTFAHFPLMTNLDNTKLSKRHGSTFIKDLHHIHPVFLREFLLNIGRGTKADTVEASQYSTGNVKCDWYQIYAQHQNWLTQLDYRQAQTLFGVQFDEAFWNIAKYDMSDLDDVERWAQIHRGRTFGDKLSWQHILAANDTWPEICKQIEQEYNLHKKEIAQSLRFRLIGNRHGTEIIKLFEYWGADEIARRCAND